MGLLSRAAKKNKNGAASKPAPAKAGILEARPGVLEELINHYLREYKNFGCVVFEKPHNKTEKDVCKELIEMLDILGDVVPLTPERQLILLPPTLDRDLIAHRLSKNINIKAILSFQANNPESAFRNINSLY